MTTLRPMTEAEFQAFYQSSRQSYAADKVATIGMSADEADRLAAESFARLVPDGLATKDAHFYMAEDAAGAVVGWLWFNIRRDWGMTECFIFDIAVHEPHRRQGHAAAMLKALEPLAASLGATSIGLHVFGWNDGAIELYRKAGFAVTDLNMSMKIAS